MMLYGASTTPYKFTARLRIARRSCYGGYSFDEQDSAHCSGSHPETARRDSLVWTDWSDEIEVVWSIMLAFGDSTVSAPQLPVSPLLTPWATKVKIMEPHD